MAGGKGPRRKGSRHELEVVKAARELGFGAEKIPLSGAAGGAFSSDITIPILGSDWKGECKARANGFIELYRWLEPCRFLNLKADRKERLVVLRESDFLTLAWRAELNKNLPSASTDSEAA